MMSIRQHLSKFFEKANWRKPSVVSTVPGLQLVLEEKQDKLGIVQTKVGTYQMEDRHYQVTVKSTGDDPQYPVNDNILSHTFAMLAESSPGDKRRTYVATKELSAYPAGAKLKHVSLDADPSDPEKFLLSARFRNLDGVTTMGVPVSKTLASTAPATEKKAAQNTPKIGG